MQIHIITIMLRKHRNIQMAVTLLLLFLISAALPSGALGDIEILPTYVVPSHYSLNLVLDPANTTYEGFVQIKFSAATALHDIVKLHASPETIEIQNALLNYNHSCSVTEHNNETEIVTLTCPSRSFQIENTLIVRFRGTISTEKFRGLYRRSYEEDGKEEVLLATQFEALDARRAFPCLDEPKWKTTFDVFITHPNEYSAISNAPVVKQFSVAPNQIQTQFKTTPLMSTYLVAFVVSKFVSITNNNTNGEYDYTVFSRPSAKDFTTVAATYGPTLIDLLSNWTGIAYKDLGNAQAYQVAIADFDSEGMENWGLVIFSEENLLDEKEMTSNSHKQRIISMLTHELAHHWFGDYVTLDWWSDVWLNEGLATYFEYYISDQLDDNLETMAQFVVERLQPVLQLDANPSINSLSSDIDSAEDCDNKFDDISYFKGASIIRMLRNVIGESAFMKGIQSYLLKYKYNNTNPSLLLDSFTIETPLGLDKIMNNWIYKSGFPLVTAKLNGSTVTLTQERFTLTSTSDAETTQWYIPISYTTKTKRNFDSNIKGWLDPNSTFEIKLDDNSWIILNVQQAGYYRVNYDDTLWQRIIDALRSDRNKIHVLNRAQLIDDVFNIAKTGRIDYQIAFHLTEYLRFETEYYPWVSALNALSFISGKLEDDEIEQLLKDRILYLINKAFPPKNPHMGSSHVDKLKEVLILYWACRLGQEECIIYAQKNFQQFKTNYSLPDYNKRGLVLCYGFRHSPEPTEDYNFLLNLFTNSTSVKQQYDILFCLACSNKSDLLSQFLTETITENSPIKKQHLALVFGAVYTNSDIGVNVSLNFFENNMEKIIATYEETLPDLLLNLASKINTKEDISRLRKIIEDSSDIEDINLISQQAIDIAISNKNWTEKYSLEIKKTLEEPITDAGNVPAASFLLAVITSFIF